VAAIGRRRYVVRDLQAIQIIRSGGARDRRIVALSALASGLVAIPVIGRASAAVGAVVLAGMALYVGFCLRTNTPGQWSLVAVYRGQLTTIFVSEDQREFDQVCRGLQRCLEYRDRTAWLDFASGNA
jgi:hypothetical protein